MESERHYGAIEKSLDRIIGIMASEIRRSMYYDRYEEELNGLCIEAADLLNDLERLIEKLGEKLPEPKKYHLSQDFITSTGIYWFNTVVIGLPDTDITALMEWEGNYSDENKEATKRRRSLERLSLPATITLVPKVCKILVHWRRLLAQFEAITGIIAELDFLHEPNIKRDGTVKLHDAVWVE